MSLWQDFLNHDGKIIHKWTHYFPVYERHFSWYRDKSVTFLEIGVSKGGSLGMWQRYFGPLARIVGVDIDPKCAKRTEDGTFVRIGDQSDPKFLQALVDEFGAPDIVLDDGSHVMKHVNATFDFLYPLMPKNGVYMVEDLHTAYWDDFGGGVAEPASFINRCKGFVDQVNSEHTRGKVKPGEVGRNTFGVHFYDSAVVLEKCAPFQREAWQMGKLPLATEAKNRLKRTLRGSKGHPRRT